MYKLIAIDLDGTLLNPYGKIMEEDKIIIQKAIEKGIMVVLATGRSINSTLNFANEIGNNQYLISGNGAVIYDIFKGEIIYNHYLPRDKVLEIIDICEKNSIYYSIFTENTIITKSLNYNVLFYCNENRNKEEKRKTQINIVENVKEYIQNNKELNFLKISICDSDNCVFSSILKQIKKINKIDVLEVSHMARKKIIEGTQETDIQYFYTEITKVDTNKWNAIKFLAERLQIADEQIMTIGDNSNDLEMIKNAGLGVAMGNSAPEIRNEANQITISNDENGVGKAIEKMLQKYYN